MSILKMYVHKVLLLSFLIISVSTANHRIAVLPFQNNGSSSMDFMSNGLSDMFITSFSQTNGITVVERSRIYDLMQEMELSLTGMVDEATAVELGRLLGANKVVLGSFIKLGSEIRIDARVVDVELGSVVPGAARAGTAEALEDIDNVVDGMSAEIASTFGDLSSDLIGDPSLDGELHITFTETGVMTPVVDGTPYTFDEGNYDGGNTCKFTVSHGNHLVEVVKGIFRRRTLISEYFDLPGGYRTRMRYDVANNSFTIYDSEPTEELLAKRNSTPEVITVTSRNETNENQNSGKRGSHSNENTNFQNTNQIGSVSVNVNDANSDFAEMANGSATVVSSNNTESVSVNVNGFEFSMTVTDDNNSNENSTVMIDKEVGNRELGAEEHHSEESSVVVVDEADNVISNSRFLSLKRELENEAFEDDRVGALTYALRNKSVTGDQLKELVECFTFEDSQMEVAKFGYERLMDTDEFYKVIAVFDFSFTRDELREWAASQE